MEVENIIEWEIFGNGSSDKPSWYFDYSDSNYINIFLNILAWFFLSVGLFDFLLQSGVILVFFFVSLFEPRKSSRRVFGSFIMLVFVILRAIMCLVILAPIMRDWLTTSWILMPVTYVGGITTTVVYSTGVIFAFIYLIKYGISGAKAQGHERVRDPMVVILMPIYNETPEVLFRAIDSMLRVDYPANRKHLFLSFDDSHETELYFHVLVKFGVLTPEVSQNIREFNDTEKKSSINSEFPARIDIEAGGMAVTICRFPHGGKNSTQGHAFRLVQELYSESKDNVYILSIDSDIILHVNAIHNFLAYAESHPNFVAATGLLTCSTQFKFNIYQYMQNAEYVESQIFIRAGEAGLGAVTCLPGAMTFVKMTSLQAVSNEYFYGTKDIKSISLFRFHREAFGEDRYLTYLLIKIGNKPYQVAYIPNAICKTDAPNSFMALLKQRRRWLLGAMGCEVYQMTSPIIWKRFPALQIYKLFIYESRSLDWVSWVIFLSFLNFDNWDKITEDWLLFLFPLLVVFKYLIFSVFCLLSKRRKLCLVYILLLLFMPAFTLFMVLYSIWTWKLRSWGGPRADEAKIDSSKVEDAIPYYPVV